MAVSGVNVSGANSYAGENPFLDRWKTAATWLLKGPDGANLTSSLVTDANGWPLSLPAGAELYKAIGVDPVELGTTDRYVMTYEGTATFRVSNAKIISQEDGKAVIEVLSGDRFSLAIKSIDANDPIHDIHLVREDQVDAFNSGAIFNPAFIDKMSDWSLIRFMDWQGTNGSPVQHWDQLATVDSESWNSFNEKGGVPLEMMVALSNQAKADMWYSIPAEADDDFVHKALEYIRDNLDPSLALHVEYSNEVWNWGFQQSKYALTMGDQLWGTDANGDGVIDPNDAKEHVGNGWLLYYGYRSAQIADIGNQVFAGQDGRLVNIISTQTATEGREAAILDGIGRANLGTVGSLFDSLSITGYLTITTDESQIMSWARSGAAGMAAAFASLGLNDPSTGALAKVIKDYAYYANVAGENGLNLDVYESGAHFVAQQYSQANQAEISDFFAALTRDPRMADLYKMSIDAFKDVGGDVMTAYTDVREPTLGGYWGLLDSIYDDRSERYLAYIENLAKDDEPRGRASLGLATADILEGGSGNDTMSGLGGNDRINGYAGYDFISGDEGNDTLNGGAANDTLNGNVGNDSLDGGDGNDNLDGGTGSDRMVGGNGMDVYFVDSVADTVVEAEGGGIDRVNTTLSTYVLPAWVEKLEYIGTGSFKGTGNGLDNTILGAAGNDTLDGAAGNDTLSGGAGNDTYIVDAVGDAVIEGADGGTDTVKTTLARYTLAASLENLVYTGLAAFSGEGNAFANRIEGAAANDSLRGGLGNDVLIGNGGNDTLDGGAGADTMQGGLGNDFYRVDDTGDRITEAAGAGSDRVEASVSFTLSSNIEDLVLKGTGNFFGNGNAVANSITGTSGANDLRGMDGDDTLFGLDGGDVLRGGSGKDRLDGGLGADTMYGGLGNDSYQVNDAGDRVNESTGEGTDDVTSTIDFTLSVNVENLYLVGTARNGTGNSADNTIVEATAATTKTVTLSGLDGNDALRGSDNANLLNGGAGNDQLRGGGGNDTLVAGTGVDQLYGGAGADRFVFASAAELGNSSETRDWVNDFSATQGDKIDLSGIDAVNGGSNSTFTYIGNAAFSGHAGELRTSLSAAMQIIMGDLNGDGVADITLAIKSDSGWLQASDFIL